MLSERRVHIHTRYGVFVYQLISDLGNWRVTTSRGGVPLGSRFFDTKEEGLQYIDLLTKQGEEE